MKLILTIVGVLAAVWLLVLGIGRYLAPNDLANCGSAPSSQVNCQAADAVVVISGGDTVARTKAAVKLLQNNWANYLVVSGAASDPDSPSNAVVMRAQAIAEGVPESQIILEENSKNTSENAHQIAKIAESKNWSSLILVTSPYHQRRAKIEFERALPGVTIINHPASNDRQWSNLWWLSLRGWWLALSELVKIVVTSFEGGLNG